MSGKRNFDELEKRRLQAAQLLRSGMYPAQVAKELGVSRTSVFRWEQMLTVKGIKSLRKADRAGRKSPLDEAARQRIMRRIKEGALACGFATDLWTLSRIGFIIKEETGLVYTESGIWRLLQNLGFSSQRPTTKAIQRNEEAIEKWKKHRWPLLKKTPSRRGKP